MIRRGKSGCLEMHFSLAHVHTENGVARLIAYSQGAGLCTVLASCWCGLQTMYACRVADQALCVQSFLSSKSRDTQQGCSHVACAGVGFLSMAARVEGTSIEQYVKQLARNQCEAVAVRYALRLLVVLAPKVACDLVRGTATLRYVFGGMLSMLSEYLSSVHASCTAYEHRRAWTAVKSPQGPTSPSQPVQACE